MKESGYYPEGAEFDPSAPYNQIDYPEEDFAVAVSCSLSKETTVTTSNYDGGEYDEDGVWCAGDINNPVEAYEESEHPIEDIISFAKDCAEHMIEAKDYSIMSKYGLESMVRSCKGWTVDELNVEKNY